MPLRYQLAQLNVARMRAPLDDSMMRGFVNRLLPVNASADAAPGFVWRLQDDTGHASRIRAFDDPRIIVNLTVWESIEALYEFVYQHPDHRDVLRRRREWFEPIHPSVVLWWLKRGSLPTLEDAKQRLEYLRDLGPTPQALTFKKRFPPPGQREPRARHVLPSR